MSAVQPVKHQGPARILMVDDNPSRLLSYRAILEPLGENSFIEKFLNERGPGLHHVTLEVDDADAAASWLRECGIEPFGGPRVSYDWKEMFVHPKASGGVLFQLYEQLAEPGNPGAH